MNILSKKNIEENWTALKKQGATTKGGLARTFTLNGVSLTYVPEYPSYVLCEASVDGVEADEYFGIDTDDFEAGEMPCDYLTEEQVEELERLFLGELFG